MTGDRPLVSVVIPAHNEQSVINRCLRTLTATALPGELDVIVVANGCRDRTADAAREHGVRVVETAVPGKANALRLGDEHCRTFPRLYLDADIELSTESVRLLVDAVRTGHPLAVEPGTAFDLTGASWPAGRFHHVLDRLRGPSAPLSGAGAYLVTEAGHARVFPMPDIIADDAWVHRHFAPGERIVVTGATALVRPPRTALAAIRRRARVRLGNRELDRMNCRATGTPFRANALGALVRDRTVSVPDAACFAAMVLAERALANWREFRGTRRIWAADRTSRAAG